VVATAREQQRLGARRFVQRRDVLTVADNALTLEFAQIGQGAAHALERREQRTLLRVGRVAQEVDRATDLAGFRLLARRRAERTLAEEDQKERRRAPGAKRQSAAFGGGPI
jgi:hypothetical protein